MVPVRSSVRYCCLLQEEFLAVTIIKVDTHLCDIMLNVLTITMNFGVY
jgi:hypothetical protein